MSVMQSHLGVTAVVAMMPLQQWRHSSNRSGGGDGA